MRLRTAAATIALLSVGSSPAAADRVPTVMRVHPSPTELRRVCVVGGTIVAANAGGQWFSLPVAEVAALAGRGAARLTPRWLPTPSPPGAICEPVRPADDASQLDGFPVTGRALLAGSRYTATLGGGLRWPSGGPIPGSPAEIHDLAVADGLVLLAHDDGLAVFEGRSVAPIPLRGPPASDITAIEVVGGDIWAGSFDRGLARFRAGRWESIRVPDAHGAGWINALCWDGATLWVGGAAGLGRWDPDREAVVPEPGVSGRIQSLRCDDGGVVAAAAAAVWIGRDGGWRSIELPGEALHSALAIGDDLWVAGLRGILHRDGAGWRRSTELNGELPDSWVTALLPVGNALWAGTYDAGLIRRGRGGRWVTEIAGAWVNPNAMDHGPPGIAVGTMGDGLLIGDGDRRRWRRLTTASGLPSDDVTAVRWAEHSLWVGTRAGIAEVRWLEDGLSPGSGSSPRAP